MKRLILKLNQRAIELDGKIENAKSEEMEYLYSGKLMEIERIMRLLIDMGYAELDHQNERLLERINRIWSCMQIEEIADKEYGYEINPTD